MCRRTFRTATRAYGRTRDVDAVRVILSFCNSDRIQLREAAREAVSAIGEPSIWQLRDAYLNLTGNKAPRDFTWDRIARELFAMYDRARLAEVLPTVRELGIGFVPEDRKLQALFLRMAVRENISVPVLTRIGRTPAFPSRSKERLLASKYIGDLNIRTPSMEQLVEALR